MFSAETLQNFAREVAKYPAEHKQSASMACLAHAQAEKGWLSSESIEAVATYLGMPPILAKIASRATKSAVDLPSTVTDSSTPSLNANEL